MTASTSRHSRYTEKRIADKVARAAGTIDGCGCEMDDCKSRETLIDYKNEDIADWAEMLDWDHLRDKMYTPSDMYGRLYLPYETIDAEIAKCRLICAFCHRKHTKAQRAAGKAK